MFDRHTVSATELCDKEVQCVFKIPLAQVHSGVLTLRPTWQLQALATQILRAALDRPLTSPHHISHCPCARECLVTVGQSIVACANSREADVKLMTIPHFSKLQWEFLMFFSPNVRSTEWAREFAVSRPDIRFACFLMTISVPACRTEARRGQSLLPAGRAAMSGPAGRC